MESVYVWSVDKSCELFLIWLSKMNALKFVWIWTDKKENYFNYLEKVNDGPKMLFYYSETWSTHTSTLHIQLTLSLLEYRINVSTHVLAVNLHAPTHSCLSWLRLRILDCVLPYSISIQWVTGSTGIISLFFTASTFKFSFLSISIVFSLSFYIHINIYITFTFWLVIRLLY